MFSKYYTSKEADIESEKKPLELATRFLEQSSSNSNYDDDDADAQGSIHSVEQTYTVKRTLNSRSINLIAIGGSIGTALFVTISKGLYNGGPLNLFLAFFIWSSITFCVIASIAEMVIYIPITAPFIQMAGRCVDEAFEVIVGMNYWLLCSVLIPFEIVAVNSMIHFWATNYSPAITLSLQIVFYTLLNLFAVRLFGEIEFWLSLGKLIMAMALIIFTFITMVGGNPQHDAFGFRYWNDPGPMNELITTGVTGRFHGFMACLSFASFACVGPEYLSMVAGETGQETRKILKKSFKSVFYRMFIFYVVGSLCVGIIIPSNDPTLTALLGSGSTSNGSFSPYVIAMNNMKIEVLPHIVNVLCVTAALSAGNSNFYCSSRALLSMANNGLAPKIFSYCTKKGVPIYCVGMAFLFSLLSLLQLGASGATVLNWIVNIVSSAQILNYFLMCITYLGFYKACNAQGVDRSQFSYTSWYQPYTIIFAMVVIGLLCVSIGYTCLMPGAWDVQTFITSYIMIFLDGGVYIAYKLIKRTKAVSPYEADLISGLAEIEQHELKYLEKLEAQGKDINKSLWKRIIDWLF